MLPADPRGRFYVGCWVHEQNKLGVTPRIDSTLMQDLIQWSLPNVRRRTELFLQEAIALTPNQLSETFSVTDIKLKIASWSYLDSDCRDLAQYLLSENALVRSGRVADIDNYRVTVRGHFVAEDQSARRASSSQCFVAMWFDATVQSAFTEAIRPAILNAGYEPIRIDMSQHINKIDDEIIAEIRRSAFLVADFTGQRGGVYYEAGFAHGLGKRVIFTCHTDAMKDLHFDVRQYNTIVWEDSSTLLPQLQNRILAIFGAGPFNPGAKSIASAQV